MHFTDRQRAWLAASKTTEDDARTMLQGRPAGRVPSRAPDELAEVMFWLGLAFTGLGVSAWFATSTGWAASPAVPGLVMVLVAVARRFRRLPPAKVDIITVRARFETRTTEDTEGAPVTIRYLLGHGTELVWPSCLHAISAELAPEEEVRIALMTRGASQYVAWAIPLGG